MRYYVTIKDEVGEKSLSFNCIKDVFLFLLLVYKCENNEFYNFEISKE